MQCPAGFYCSGGASKGDGTGSGAGVCPIGYYCPAGTNAPILCTPGKYCATTGLQTPTGDCTAGYYWLEGSSTATPSSGAMGGPCPAGSYCVAGSSIYIQCAVGTYNPNTGSTSSAACVTWDAGKKCLSRGLTAPSTNCPAGYYCTQNPYTLKACEQGYYCPSGSSSQTKWPSGQYQANTLQSSWDICPVGYYWPQSDTTRKIICPAGSYWVSGQAAATAWPTGTYGPREGLQSSSACEQWPNGKYCGTTGLTSTGTDCTAGYYCTRGSSSATQNICPIGYYWPAGTTAPVPCPAGTYNDLTGKGLLTDCKSCPAGKFCPDAAMTAAPTTSTYNCAAGFIWLGGAKTKYPLDGVTGRLCNKGYYCSSGATADTICQDGTYNPYSGMIACINCPKGYYCDKTKDTTTKIACPAGNYCPAGTPGTINKYQCPAGTYSANTKLSASADCTPCDPGKYCLIGSTGVSGNWAAGYVCPRGASVSNPSATFSFDGTDSVNFNKPGKCPTGHRWPSASYYPIPWDDGTYQDLEAQSVCKSCPAGNYWDSTGIISVSSKAWEAGHYWSGGTKVKKPIKTTHSGSIWSSGKYWPAGTTTELSCPAGYYDKRKGSPQCMTCPAGYYCPLGSTEPTVCPATMYWTAGVGAGTYCTAGTYNTADGLESAAQWRPCPVSKYCTSGQIQGSCDSGYFWDSGANASNDDSKKCPKNAYWEAGTAAPVRWESGKVNPNFYGNSPSSWVTCTAGYYCPETGDGAQITWPKGYYCVAGVTQPTAWPVGTYVGSTGSTSSSSCTTWGAGYLCNVEGVGTIADFSCPVGYYCTAGSKNPTKCPAGTYRNTVGAGASTDCAQWPGGFYWTEGTISPIICPSGTYCPAGSTKTTACTAGYYCPPQTTTPINCPQAYYCPEGIETYIKCNNGTYCPTNSASPTLWPGGTFGNGNPNNYNSAVACVQWDAGTYTTTATPGDCLPCTAGYVCLGNTITATPVTSSTDNGYEWPVGYYWPTGSSKEIACPAGTYTDTKRTGTLSGCKSCPAGSYNDQIGQKGCKQCGGTATSSIGAKSCTCKGIGREYQAGNGEWLCAKGYSKADKTTDINSDQNWELSTTITMLRKNILKSSFIKIKLYS